MVVIGLWGDVEQGCCFRATQTLRLNVMKPTKSLGFKFKIFFFNNLHEFSWHLEFGKVRAEFGVVRGYFLKFRSKIFKSTNRENSGMYYWLFRVFV
jgi:hypothetical protein